MSEQLAQGIVRILDGNGDIAGTGFVISQSGLIATCSHVIQHEVLQERGTLRPEKVTVVFHATGDEQDALVEPQWWLPWNAGDLAIIRVEGMLPQGVQPLPLGPAEGTSGHEISTFGFPDVDAIEGLGGGGRVVRVLPGAGRPMLQLQSSEITVGFSGAPIWDKLGRCVIGMVSAITEPDRHHRLVETAFAISTETLRNVCQVLQLSEVCPYRGLVAFTEADTEFFFGRQQIVDGLLSRLRRDPRFLTVLGPSGSGKSSVVQAGLIPQVRSGKVPGSDHWGIIVIRPAVQPFDELAKQGVVDGSRDLTENVQVWLSQHTEQERLMLVIDQFEELLSMCPEAIRQDFIIQLVKLLHSPLPITVVLVMRDDFYSRLTQQEALVEWLERSRGPIHVPRFLNQGELIAMVQKPITAVGLRFEEGLVDTIVKDTLETSLEAEEGEQVGRSAILPLLEFALTELWEQRQGGMLTHEAYSSIGGVAGALPQWADRAFNALKLSERRLAQRILTSLVYIGDKSQGIFDSRRRRTLPSLCQNAAEQESVERVVQHFVANHLLTTDRDLQSNEETVEIIHDVLLRKWGLLQEWLEEDRRFLTWHQELERFVHGWTTQHDRAKLLRGRDLTEAGEWLKERGTDLNQDEIAFLRASAAYRVSFVVRMIAVFLLLVSSASVAGWFALTRLPDPTLVTTLQDGVNGSLRDCVNRAPSGSTITFTQDLRGTIRLTGGDLVIGSGKRLTLRGPGADRLTISGGNADAKIHVSKGATLDVSRLSFKDSQTILEAFFYNEGSLTVRDSIISNNRESTAATSYGGAITNTGTLTVISSTISGNTADGDADGQGGGIFNEGQLTVINSTIRDNQAISRSGMSYGGGINNFHGTVTVTNNSTLSNNTARSGGNDQNSQGGAINNNGKLSVADSTISRNTAVNGNGNSLGGGIYNYTTSTLAVTSSTFLSNSASSKQGGQGGGIDNQGQLSVTASTFSNNTVRSDGNDQESVGGAISNNSQLSVTASTFSNNSASDGKSFGGGIYNYKIGTVTGSTFLNNSSSGKQYSRGGGIGNQGQLSVTASTFSNNTVRSGGNDQESVGGAISNSGQLSVTASTFSNNSASGGKSFGGGVDNTRTLMVTSSTFLSNSASGKQGGQGGGINSQGQLTVTNSTFWSNTASGGNDSGGGGIAFLGLKGSSAIIRFCTLYGNSSSAGGGLRVETTGSSALTISSSIVAANRATDGPDIAGVLTSGGYNLLQSFAGATGLNAPTDKQVTLSDLKIEFYPTQQQWTYPDPGIAAGEPGHRCCSSASVQRHLH